MKCMVLFVLALLSVAVFPMYCQSITTSNTDYIKIGESREDVINIMGAPDGSSSRRKKRETTDDWMISNYDTLIVTFRNDRAVKIRHLYSHPAVEDAGNAGNKVVSIANRLYLVFTCPALYRRPVLFLTTADIQVIQQCNANGYMLFGAYIYTGPQ